MTIQKTAEILSALMLIAMLVIIPISNHALASNKAAKTNSSDVPKTSSKSKQTIEQKNLRTEARHKKIKK